jgi:hypothetical protein
MPEATQAAKEYDKSVAKGYENAAKVMDDLANKIGGAGQTLGPTVTSISPNQATPGALITITGTNFGARQGTGSVKFGSIAAKVRSWTEISITAQVPDIPNGDAAVVVSVEGRDSAAASFKVIHSRVIQTIGY